MRTSTFLGGGGALVVDSQPSFILVQKVCAKMFYVFVLFCACGWGGVLFTKFWTGKACFYVFMFPETKPVDKAYVLQSKAQQVFPPRKRGIIHSPE